MQGTQAHPRAVREVRGPMRRDAVNTRKAGSLDRIIPIQTA